ncbi:hypothetical protein ACOSQ2_009429 [Xanthoceras sorbifolium]|uniref:Uncharacterized protein n=1 Tax=Xanthoceras sorbifolium TaxID=99658 RepID=A0ABQ8HVJ5_9ROSI|nr:hypothetical protein JRO89_XS07G0278000 [Xanthoceras sorbifolium]
MESTNSKTSIAVSSSTKLSSKRLLFDRRYGWVYDEWTDPAEEALAGGRGMFCVLPIAKALLNTAVKTINLTASSALKVYENADLSSPQLLPANLSNHLHKLTSRIQKPEINPLDLKGHPPSDFVNCSPQLHMENRERTIA